MFGSLAAANARMVAARIRAVGIGEHAGHIAQRLLHGERALISDTRSAVTTTVIDCGVSRSGSVGLEFGAALVGR